MNRYRKDFGGILSGALSGAGSGAALGPWGAAGGAALGIISGIISGNKQKKEEERQRQIEAAMAKKDAISQSNANASMYPTQGIITNTDPFSFAKYGTTLPYKTMQGGGMVPINSDTAQFVGPNHSKGGIKLGMNNPMTAPIAEVEGGELIKDNMIISKRLPYKDLAMKLAKNQKNIEKSKSTSYKQALNYIDSKFGEIEQAQAQFRQTQEGLPMAENGMTIDPPVDTRPYQYGDKKPFDVLIGNKRYIQDSGIDPMHLPDDYEFVDWYNPEFEEMAMRNAATAKGMDGKIRTKEDMMNKIHEGHSNFIEKATPFAEALSTLTPQTRAASLALGLGNSLRQGNYGEAALNSALAFTPFKSMSNSVANTSKVLNTVKKQGHNINEYAPYAPSLKHMVESQRGPAEHHMYGGSLKKYNIGGILGPAASLIGGMINDKRLKGPKQPKGVNYVSAQKVYNDINPYMQQERTLNQTISNNLNNRQAALANMIQNRNQTNRAITESNLGVMNTNAQLAQQAASQNAQIGAQNAAIENEFLNQGRMFTNSLADRTSDRLTNFYNQLQVSGQQAAAEKNDRMKFEIGSYAYDDDTRASLMNTLEQYYPSKKGLGNVGKLFQRKDRRQPIQSIQSKGIQTPVNPLSKGSYMLPQGNMLNTIDGLIPKEWQSSMYGMYGGKLKKKGGKSWMKSC